MTDPREAPTLIDLLREHMALRPDHVVYTYLVDGEDEEESVTYSELDRRARAIACGLRAQGVEPGDRVLLIYNSDMQFVAGFFGALYAGAVAVPGYPPRVHKSLPDQNLARLTAIAADCAPKLMLTSQSVLDRIGHVLPELPRFKDLPVFASDPMEQADPDAWVMPPVDGDTLAFLQYTSGSTGNPKGAMLTHGNLMANLDQLQWTFRMYDEPTTVGWLPLHHDMGLIAMLLEGLYDGGKVVFLSPLNFIQRPMRWMRAITKYRGNAALGPDFGFRLVAGAAQPEDVAQLELAQLHSVYNGAEPVRADTLAYFTRVFAPAGFKPEHHYPCYGMAEACVLVSGWHPGRPPVVVNFDGAELEQHRLVEVDADHPNARPLVGCGVPPKNLDVAIAHPDTGARVGPDEVGEIWIAGPNIAAGYWEKPEINAESFGARTTDGAGPYYRTGDLGFLRDDVLYICGRLKDLVIIDGRNHYPQDIERTVEDAHAKLRSGGGAAFSIEVDGIERLVVVNEVDRRARDLDVEEVVRAIRGAVSIAHEVTPYQVVLLKAGGLPKTSSGKVQRRACREQLKRGDLQVVGQMVFE